MREQLKKVDVLGLAIIAGTLIAYSVRNAWSIYQTIGIVLGVALVLVSIASKSAEIPGSLSFPTRSYWLSGTNLGR